jgi:hypothetical protein
MALTKVSFSMIDGASINVVDYGAVGDFNPITGAGTDSRAAIQQALTYAQSVPGGCEVVFPPGGYYLGAGYADSTTGVAAQLLLGSRSSANAATNVVLRGAGATIYQGAAGAALFMANCTDCRVTGLRMVGYVGGTLGASREYDTLITMGYTCKNTLIDSNYITNSLGWTIMLTGDPTIAGGGTTFTCQNTKILNNTIKMRYGNGTVSSSGGSKSQRAFQTIDCVGLKISNNVIYGDIDIEPNVNAQRLINIDVSGNQFQSGYVTPVIPGATSTFWQDEALGIPGGGGTIIPQAVQLSGIPASPVVSGCSIKNNTFQYGTIVTGTGPYVAEIVGNEFYEGLITLGNGDGINYTQYMSCSNNTAQQTIGSTAFIVLNNPTRSSVFTGNQLITENFPVIAITGTGTDNANNVFNANSSLARTQDALSLGAISATTRRLGNAPIVTGEVASIAYAFSLAAGATKTITVTVPAGYGHFIVTAGGNQAGAEGYAYAQFLLGGDFSDSATPAYAFSTVVAPVSNVRLSFSTITRAAGSFSFQAISSGGANTASITVTVVGALHTGATPSIVAA